MSFDIRKHLIKVQGGREYLPVAYRLVWFRQEHPDWGIQTELVTVDLERGAAVFKAAVFDAEGLVVATGTKMETARGFGDYIEKAETGAIGRALGVLGFGTQFCVEFDEGERLADSPMPISAPSEPATRASKPSVANIRRDFGSCAECGRPLTRGQQDLSVKKFGKLLCPSHQHHHALLE